MKASELIKRIEALIQVHGDIEVVLSDKTDPQYQIAEIFPHQTYLMLHRCTIDGTINKWLSSKPDPLGLVESKKVISL